MAKSREKTVLFLCTGNYYRSRFAEILFNSVAGKMGLPWKASSRGLDLKPGVNVGPIAVSIVRLLKTKRLRADDEVVRLPVQVIIDDFKNADLIVALKEAEHLPMLHERFSAWTEKVEFWNVDDAPEALAVIEREVMGLTARLIGGGNRREPLQEGSSVQVGPEAKAQATKTNAAVVKVGRETKGRRGKGVTTVFDVPLDEAGLLDLATKLKQRCGTGGTVKDSRIEIQGEQRERLVGILEDMGYRVKRVGVEMQRCPWAKSELYVRYHDTEWRVPVHDDRMLFEFLILEGAQAGLSWETILKKRANYQAAFDQFDPAIIAKYGMKKRKDLLSDAGIARNRLKIEAAIQTRRHSSLFGMRSARLMSTYGNMSDTNQSKTVGNQ